VRVQSYPLPPMIGPFTLTVPEGTEFLDAFCHDGHNGVVWALKGDGPDVQRQLLLCLTDHDFDPTEGILFHLASFMYYGVVFHLFEVI
jgi:hypothetical protein